MRHHSPANAFTDFTVLSIQDVLRKTGSSVDGLTDQEAKARTSKEGGNQLSGTKVVWWKVLLRQFSSPFLYLLVIASIVSFLLSEMVDGYMILIFVAINTLLGFYQEYRSEKTLELLKQYVLAKAKVLRLGKEIAINSPDLVPGDIVLLAPGDIIPADIRFLKTVNLTVDESALTGESVPVVKQSDSLSKEVTEAYLAKNIGFLGTSIVGGKGKGVVIAVGRETDIGRITSLTTLTSHLSSFEKGISRLSSFILKTILVTLVFIVIANILLKGVHTNILTLIVFAIALAISVIPEALPVVTTFSFSRGALHLAKHKVVVKRLSAIEDLGSIEVLCSDKTGTLTENVLTLMDYFPKKTPEHLLFAALSTPFDSENRDFSDPFDLAISKEVPREARVRLNSYKKVDEIPFTPIRRRNSVLFAHENDFLLVVRGAPELLFSLCDMHATEKKEAEEWMQKEGRLGRRVISVAIRRLSKKPEKTEEMEKNLRFIGIFSFEDPLKKTASEAIVKAERLGVTIKILTGDSKDVAGVVAYRAGLITDQSHVMTGDVFDGLDPKKQLLAVDEYNVFARVSPIQKHAIVQLLQQKYEVGFLGEGINDAPALKAANVAIVVQSASDIAREAADIVLLHKSLDVIVDGIREGREIFGNTIKYIKATLASNFGNFYTVAIASLFIPFLPLLPLQILLINLLTDFPMIAVATDTIDAEELKRPKSYDIKEIALFAVIMGAVSTVFDFLFFLLFYKISPGVLQTNWFVGSVLTELLFLFAIRTKLPVWKAKFASLPLTVFSLLAFFIAIVLPYTPFGKGTFFFIQPSGNSMFLILLITVSYFVATEFVKQLYYKFLPIKNSEVGGNYSLSSVDVVKE